MAFCMNEDGQLLWKLLEPGEQIVIYTGLNTWKFEMSDEKLLVLISDLRGLPAKISEYVRFNRNVQEVLLNQDINMSEMVVYLRPTFSLLGEMGAQCTFTIRLVAKARITPWDKSNVLLLNDEMIRLITPVGLFDSQRFQESA